MCTLYNIDIIPQSYILCKLHTSITDLITFSLATHSSSLVFIFHNVCCWNSITNEYVHRGTTFVFFKFCMNISNCPNIYLFIYRQGLTVLPQLARNSLYRLTLNLVWSFCLSFPSPGFRSIYHYTQPNLAMVLRFVHFHMYFLLTYFSYPVNSVLFKESIIVF